jgi:periplasmic protein TonB
VSRSRRQRRGAARAAARARVSDLVVRPLSPETRAFDPTDHRRQQAGARVAGLAGLVLGSAVTHALLVGAGVLVAFLVPDDEEEKDDGPVAVEVREREPEPEPDKPPEPAPVDVTPRRIEKASKPPPRPVEPPPADPPPKAPPRRVVGLSFESTVGGGSGSTFAAGETRSGTTEKTAADPARKKAPPPTPEAGTGNKQATRIPTAGVKLLLPKRKKPVVPDYPPALKAQGIEADVPVMVSLDATGAVTSVKILKSSGHPELDEAARKAALAESFEPASRDGVAIPYTLSYTYRFRLEDG